MQSAKACLTTEYFELHIIDTGTCGCFVVCEQDVCLVVPLLTQNLLPYF